MSVCGPWRRRAPRARPSVPILLAAAMALAGGPADAADYSGQVSIKPTQVYMKNDRGRVVLSVLNNSSEILDIDVSCIFYAADQKKIGSGRGQVARLRAHRSDTVEVVDEIAWAVDNVTCSVTDARK
jgi:hypothetical protein